MVALTYLYTGRWEVEGAAPLARSLGRDSRLEIRSERGHANPLSNLESRIPNPETGRPSPSVPAVFARTVPFLPTSSTHTYGRRTMQSCIGRIGKLFAAALLLSLAQLAQAAEPRADVGVFGPNGTLTLDASKFLDKFPNGLA